jgi:hypothetical protein
LKANQTSSPITTSSHKHHNSRVGSSLVKVLPIRKGGGSAAAGEAGAQTRLE